MQSPFFSIPSLLESPWMHGIVITANLLSLYQNHRCTGRDPQVPTFLPVLSGPRHSRHTLNHHTVQYSAPLTVHLYPTYIIEYTQQYRYVSDIRLNIKYKIIID